MKLSLKSLLLSVLSVFFTVTTAFGQVGHTLSGVGPIDQSLSGAGTANPQDIMGAFYWNPAGLTSFDGTRLSFGLQFLQPTSDLSSSVKQNAFGPDFGPPMDMSGVTESKAGPFPIPSLAFVMTPNGSPLTLGISAFGVGGFGTEYAVGANPINTPQPPNGMGFGEIKSAFSLLQVSPTIAYKLNDNFSIGVAPTINYGILEVAPFPAAPPDDANGDGFPSYAAAPSTGSLGFGFQAGVQYKSETGFSAGASFKSSQKFDTYEFDAVDEVGSPRTLTFDLNYPMMISGGVGYSLEKLELLADVRYINYKDTKGFDSVGFDQTGAVTGFGWDNVMVYALGLQYKVTDKLPVRLSYSFNDNPIKDELTFFNVPANAIITSRVSGGFSYDVSDAFSASFGLQYGFENKIEGAWKHPMMGDIPGTSVSSTLQTVFVMFGVDYQIN